MKTLAQIYDRQSNCIDGRDSSRLAQFVPECDLDKIGVKLKEEFIGKHECIEFTRENVIKQLQRDVEFGFEKALNCRGISSSMMFEVVRMWNNILEEGLTDNEFDYENNYAMYGLPAFKATAEKYGFQNPIGSDEGNERKYSEERGNE